MGYDPSGTNDVVIFGWGLKIAGLLAVADGPLPFGDALALIVLRVVAAVGLGTIIHDNWNTITNSVRSGVDELSDIIKNASTALVNYMTSRIIRETYGRDVCHIVARRDIRALPSRLIFEEVGIGIDDNMNLV